MRRRAQCAAHCSGPPAGPGPGASSAGRGGPGAARKLSHPPREIINPVITGAVVLRLSLLGITRASTSVYYVGVLLVHY